MNAELLSRPSRIASRPRTALAALRCALVVVATLICMLLRLAAGPLGHDARRAVARLWSRACAAAIGLRLTVDGAPFRGCPTLFVANHVSYLDIPILTAAIDASFVAKCEVRSWPGLGLVARLGRTYFIRRRWRDAKIQRNELAARLRAGESFVLFPEGTSTDGLDMLPFKSTLFGVAEPWILDCPIAVQPVTLAYLRHADGTVIDASNADVYAWFGDAEFLPHIWRAACAPGLEVRMTFHDPTVSWAVQSRKALALACREVIRRQLRAARDEADPTAQPRLAPPAARELRDPVAAHQERRAPARA